MFRSAAFYAIVAFLFLIWISLPVLVCMDGWESRSIGSSGACSHHGGVNFIPYYIIVSICGVLAFWIWKKIKKHETALKGTNNKVILKAEELSSGSRSLINNSCCKLWNSFIKLLVSIGVVSTFDKHPCITTVGVLTILIVVPPLITILFIFWVIAFANGATRETNFLIPDNIEGK